MDVQTKRIAGACFASGSITLWLMLSLVPLLDVWGVLLAFAIGAAIGYFGYNIRQVVQVSAKVARETIPTTVHIVPKVWKYNH